MTPKETPIENLRGYLRQLSPQTRTKLLAEVERLRLSGNELPGADIILAELRTEVLHDTRAIERLDPAARHFFRPIEPYLTDRSPERANPGLISRTSLSPIWEWLCRDLMTSLARGYAAEMKQHSNNQRAADQVVQSFQNKAVKYLDGTLASRNGAEQARARLASRAETPAVFEDLCKMLRVLKANAALTQFAEGLPVRIDKLAGANLEKIATALNAVVAKHPDAGPFGLTLVSRRLKLHWQLVRFATKATDSKAADEVAATPYAIAVTMVLDQIEDMAETLRETLRSQHIPRAKELLSDIYDSEYAVRVRIDLEDSEWADRLDDIMDLVYEALDTESIELPAGLRHVLRSRALKHHQTLIGQLTWLGWKCRDAVTDSVTHGLHWLRLRGNPGA